MTVTTPCGVVVDESLHSTMPLSVGIELPEGTGSFEASVTTSRTWQPSPKPPGDTRQIGVGVVTDWLGSADQARQQHRFVALKPCDS